MVEKCYTRRDVWNCCSITCIGEKIAKAVADGSLQVQHFHAVKFRQTHEGMADAHAKYSKHAPWSRGVPQSHNVVAEIMHERREILCAKLRHARTKCGNQFPYNFDRHNVAARTHQVQHNKG